jgi:formamidopyrimidine-DNA glycosylase
MFELPELVILAKQFETTLKGKTIAEGSLGNSPHKFVFYNRSHEEFSELIANKLVGTTKVRGRWMFTNIEPGYVLVLGELGGKILYHPSLEKPPDKYHLMLTFQGGSHLSVNVQMWGAIELYEKGKELNREYIKDMNPTPGEDTFTYTYFVKLIDKVKAGPKRSVKSLLTQEQSIPGLGNSSSADIMFRAKLNPKKAINDLTPIEIIRLYKTICQTFFSILSQGGRYDETDLYGQHGSYIRLMDKNTVDKPCPMCKSIIEKMSYLGGTTYYCPNCQK